MSIASLGTSSPRFNKTSTSAINSLPFCDAVGDKLSKCILSNSLLISSTSSIVLLKYVLACPFSC